MRIHTRATLPTLYIVHTYTHVLLLHIPLTPSHSCLEHCFLIRVLGSPSLNYISLSSIRNEQLGELQKDKEFDILVIGGGVTGCGVALDTTLRGEYINFNKDEQNCQG